MYLPQNFNSIGFFTVIVTMAVIVLGFESYIFAQYERAVLKVTPTDGNVRSIPTYLALFIFAEIFSIVMAWDALRLKNTIQTIGLCIYHTALLVYAAIQISQVQDALRETGTYYVYEGAGFPGVKGFLIALPCIIALGIALLCVFAWKLYRELNWTVYKHIGAAIPLKNRYMTFEIFITLLKFDFIFFLGFTIQFAVIILSTSDMEFPLTIAVIPLTIIVLLFCSWSVRREKIWGMTLVLLTFGAGMGYFIFKLVRMYSGPKAASYGTARRPLATFAIITIILLFLTIVNAVVCMTNFGQGLMPLVSGRKVPDPDDNSVDLNDHTLPHGLKRQVLD